ncbi:transcription-repair coupling factor [Actinobacteria bacterium YIM 96077]|uniref:Transcription-repair-coupling factor n=1 Tax=Phytoactinopolyspora halophila TaxID=1981511 RepID=A0A329QG67_9ACTN|nr:transcription-repair coupling factor [Phytoactinopolyspora halophila]AYY14442.1 transcription-repair coupling factor [Actinobacteria bacterium YIM 96077]RAW11435.1 transcription-repair coupling factor [Phytoactinopolyspora halophila]
MRLTGLLHALLDDAGDSALRSAVADARHGAVSTLDLTAPPSMRPFVVAALSDASVGADRPVLAVTATGREAEDLVTALRCLLPDDSVVEYPAWETLPHERLSPRSDTVGRRLAVLRRLVHPAEDDTPVKVVVAPVRSVLQPQVAGLAELRPVRLRAGVEVSLEDVVDQLAAAAYSRVDLVERRGEFAVRGGIVDVFPPTEEHPVRVDFWGDSIEEIRYFTVADQRSAGPVEHGLWAPPCRELLLTDKVRERAAALSEQHPELAEMLDKIAAGVAVEGMESLAPVLVDEMELLVDLLPAGSHVVTCDPERIRSRAHDLVATSQEFLDASWAAAAAGGTAPIDLGAAAYRTLADVRAHAIELGLPWWSISSFGLDSEAGSATDASTTGTTDTTGTTTTEALDAELYGVDLGDEMVEAGAVQTRGVTAKPAETYRGDTARALADVKGWLGSGGRVVVITGGHGTAMRAVELFGEAEVPARLIEDLDAAPEPGIVHVTTGTLQHGFIADDAGLIVLTEDDLTGQRVSDKSATRMPSRRRHQVDPLQLQPGDYIVHEQHGIGRYVEMTSRTVQGAVREYLVLEYAASKRGQPPDRLYVPTDQLDQVTKYVGGDSPGLDRIGGSDWAKRKGRARSAVKEIAAELIKLYAARQAAPGRAFSPDTPWQRELEDAFPYVETVDQASTINEVKSDMERTVPMDRVICGDVGYGKTEIAVRAAFKAIQEGTQVAVLVPTTLLVQQHFATFTERYAQFPVTVKALSRFQTDQEAAEVIRGLAEGSVDVVIGTHRLLTGDVRFKELGLLIVDEEQRFGVEHKEKLKQLRTNVDVLTMSATPIPRTLEMSITGIRDMSVIATPPEERHPVLTYVGGYDEKQLSAAIRRELMREGQVFYVHNRVDTIEKVTARLRELVPEARVAAAHGQMGEHTLENVITSFWQREIDVLVCTTIVETGLDISNANTLIVDHAERLGLAQLHQLRGRVGRGRERAYAYFFYPRETPLTDEAHERLATISQHSDLGSGMQVAMKDLEIRGAGNLLGGEQSGHIADVGFDLYVRLVGEAVAEYRGDAEEGLAEVRIDLPIDAHIPHDYLASERLRLEAYRRLSEAADDDAVAAVREELQDRYGPPPEPVDNLLAIARFRAKARRAGLSEVTLQGNYVRFAQVELADWQRARLQRLYPKALIKDAVRTMLVPRPATATIGGTPLRGMELLAWVDKVVDDILVHEPAPA